MHLVIKNQSSKAVITQSIDKITKWVVRFIIFASIIVWITWSLLVFLNPDIIYDDH